MRWFDDLFIWWSVDLWVLWKPSFKIYSISCLMHSFHIIGEIACSLHIASFWSYVDRNWVEIFNWYHGFLIDSSAGTSWFGLGISGFWVVIAGWWHIIYWKFVLATPYSSVGNIGAEWFDVVVVYVRRGYLISFGGNVRVMIFWRRWSVKNAIFWGISFVGSWSRGVGGLPLVFSANCHILWNITELLVWLILTCIWNIILDLFHSWFSTRAEGLWAWHRKVCSTFCLVKPRWWIVIRFELILSLPGHIVFNVLTEWQVAIVLSWARFLSLALERIHFLRFHHSCRRSLLLCKGINWIIKTWWWIRIRLKLILATHRYFLMNRAKRLMRFIHSSVGYITYQRSTPIVRALLVGCRLWLHLFICFLWIIVAWGWIWVRLELILASNSHLLWHISELFIRVVGASIGCWVGPGGSFLILNKCLIRFRFNMS